MPSTDWPFWVVGAILGFPGLYLLWRGVLADRSRGRPRCPRCWYDMTGVPSLTCPECGRVVRRKKNLHRTRRHRWGVLSGLALVIVSVGTALAPKVRRDGWLSPVPTTILLLCAPPAGEEVASGFVPIPTNPMAWRSRWHPVIEELVRRDAATRMTSWHWGLYLRHAGILAIRERWPNQARRIDIALPMWIDGLELHAKSQTPRTPRVHAGSTMGFPWMHPPPFRIPRGTDHLQFDVEVRMRPQADSSCYWEDARMLWRGDMRFPLQEVIAPDDAIRSIRSPDLDAQVSRAFFARIEDVGSQPCLVYTLGSLPGRVPTSCAFGLRIDVVRDGTSVFNTDFLADPGHGAGSASLDTLNASLPTNPEEAAGWTLRVSGDPEIAMRDQRKNRCWSGQFEIPFQRLLANAPGAAAPLSNGGP